MPVRAGRLDMIDEAFIAVLLERIAALLRDPTCTVSFGRGVHRTHGDDGNWRYTATDGQTVTIEVNGGAKETEESAFEWLARLNPGGLK
jgi:hypothetical protein